jgi:nickel-type superoxide dismutase maturation protease
MTPEGSVQLRKPRSPLLRVKVAEVSMLPALRPGDWLLVRRTRRIRPGQIVLARHPGRPGMLIVKRAARRQDAGWWLTSDNPDPAAVDSRRFGPLPDALIEGRVLFRYWRPRTPAGPLLSQNEPWYHASTQFTAGAWRRESGVAPSEDGATLGCGL